MTHGASVAPRAALSPTSSTLTPMMAISLGPVAFPLPPLLVLGAMWLAQALAARLARRPQPTDGPEDARRRGQQAGDAIFGAAVIGLLAARLAYVALHWTAYQDAPLAALDIRDGGWWTPAGVVAGVAWLLWQARRHPGTPPALAGGAGLGLALWLAAGLALTPPTGRPWPDLRFAELQGGQAVSLARVAEGRPAVVVLWASWCAPCRAEMPLLAEAQQRRPDLRFIFVNQGEDVQQVRRYLASLPFSLSHVLLDPDSALGPAVGSPGLPTTVFYGADGLERDAHFGMLNAAALRSRLIRLQPAPPASP